MTHINRIRRDAGKLEQRSREAREQIRQTALTNLAKSEAHAILCREEVTNARQLSRFQRLVSPVDGTVQQFDAHTNGGAVEMPKPLMAVVSNEGHLELKAKILDRDVGFVHAGQDVAVKLKAFPLTRCGTVSCRVCSISRNAVQEKKPRPLYFTSIVLDEMVIDANDKRNFSQ